MQPVVVRVRLWRVRVPGKSARRVRTRVLSAGGATRPREAKLRLFEQFARYAPPTGLVLGSSRSIKLKPSDLKKVFGGRFFNFAVTSSTVEDYGSIL